MSSPHLFVTYISVFWVHTKKIKVKRTEEKNPSFHGLKKKGILFVFVQLKCESLVYELL